MRNHLYFLCFVFFVSACLGPVKLQHSSIETQNGRALNYSETFASKAGFDKLALILPDYPDTLLQAQQELKKTLLQNGYKVIIPSKAGNTPQQKIALDSKSFRLNDVNALLRTIDTNGIKEFIVIGFGEGGYLVPDIKFPLPPKVSFVINAGPYSPLQEYEDHIKNGFPDVTFLHTLMERNSILSQEVLEANIIKVSEDPYGLPHLNGGTNQFWISYKEDPLLPRISKPSNRMVWIISQDYPVITKANKNLAQTASLKLNYLNYVSLPGRGKFVEKDELKGLVDVLKAEINN